jgi:hypothetical protein
LASITNHSGEQQQPWVNNHLPIMARGTRRQRIGSILLSGSSSVRYAERRKYRKAWTCDRKKKPSWRDRNSSVKSAPEATIPIEPSIGVAISPNDGFSGDQLTTKADAAMYHGRVRDLRPIWLLRAARKGCMSEGPGLVRESDGGFGNFDDVGRRIISFANVRLRGPQNRGKPWIS